MLASKLLLKLSALNMNLHAVEFYEVSLDKGSEVTWVTSYTYVRQFFSVFWSEQVHT